MRFERFSSVRVEGDDLPRQARDKRNETVRFEGGFRDLASTHLIKSDLRVNLKCDVVGREAHRGRPSFALVSDSIWQYVQSSISNDLVVSNI